MVLHTGKKENPHWHFQGTSLLTDRDISTLFAGIRSQHTKLLSHPKSHPLKRKREDPTEDGFQYMMKEGLKSVVCSRGFSKEDLEALHEASMEHVSALKAELYTFLSEKRIKFSCASLYHKDCRFTAIQFYDGQDRMPPPNFQKLVLFHMMKLARALPDSDRNKVLEYISEHY